MTQSSCVTPAVGRSQEEFETMATSRRKVRSFSWMEKRALDYGRVPTRSYRRVPGFGSGRHRGYHKVFTQPHSARSRCVFTERMTMLLKSKTSTREESRRTFRRDSEVTGRLPASSIPHFLRRDGGHSAPHRPRGYAAHFCRPYYRGVVLQARP